MKPTLVLLVLLGGMLIGCGPSAPPSSDRVKAAVIQAVKKENPEATVEVTGMSMTEDQKGINISFTCDGCTKWSEPDTPKPGVSPTGQGKASVSEHPLEKRWEIEEILLMMDDGSMRMIDLPFPKPSI